MANTLAKVVAQWVATRALEEINIDWDSKDHLRNLHKKLEHIQVIVEDSDDLVHGQKSQVLMIRWVQKVKDAAYLADDFMDDYAIQIFRKKMEFETRFSRKFCNFFMISNTIFFRYRMVRKVKGIISLLEEIENDAKEIGLAQADIAAEGKTHTYKHNDQFSLTGKHAAPSASESIYLESLDQKKLLDDICSLSKNQSHHLSTVAIVGMGGVGKTTLTRHLYDDERIFAEFGNNKVWVGVSQNFQITGLLNKMVESVTSCKSELSNNDGLVKILEKELKGKKSLFVFDDVWNDDEDLWDSLKGLLHVIGIALGSVILITSRSYEVAKAAGAVFKHKLEGLSKIESWSLLRQIVSYNGIQPINSSLEKVGKRIVEKCGGIPLAIRVLGDLLQSKHDLSEWLSIEKSELWDLPPAQSQILPSLLLSFDHLPSPSLKQCFLYSAIIPKGHYACKSELIGLWISQGYLRDEKKTNLTMEETGEENLKILVSNSLLVECMSEQSGTVGYKMQNLVFDFAVYVWGKDLIKEAKHLPDIGGCRHLVINFRDYDTTSHFPPGNKALPKLRTLGLKGTTIPRNMLIHTRNLRTLFLDRTGITEVPPAIELLQHLRYFDVSHNPISTLPDSIGKLYQLQMLILKGCTNMKKLPKILFKLVNLRCISTTAPMFAWKGLQHLTNLQSLPCLSLDDGGDGWTIDDLGDLHELRGEIFLMGLENVKDQKQAMEAKLAWKTNVSKLTLSWAGGREDNNDGICEVGVLEGLEPHPYITSLELRNFRGVEFPTWIRRMTVLTETLKGGGTQLTNLTMVKLLNCNRCQTLPKLGQLPLLKCLILRGLGVELIGPEFYGGDDLDMSGVISFKCLRELEISRFPRLTSWMNPPKPAFPSLETLRIRDCGLLESVPALEFKSLITLELKNLICMESLNIIKYNSGLNSLIIDMVAEDGSVPQGLANMSKLRSISDLRISCSSVEYLRSVLQVAQYLPLLRAFEIGGFRDEIEMRDFFSDITPFLRLPYLTELMLNGRPNIKTLPQQLGMLTRITTLGICHFVDLETFPDWICNLSSLESLELENCKNLKSLPYKEGLQRLTYLRVNCCPLLVKRYAKDEGSEWHNISHITKIIIDGKTIHDEQQGFEE